MAMTIHVDVVSAEESLFSGIAEYVVVPAEMGEIGIYPHHAPLITRIKAGSLRLKRPDQAEEELAPAEILSEAGIDITKPAFWQGGFDVLKEMILKLESM